LPLLVLRAPVRFVPIVGSEANCLYVINGKVTICSFSPSSFSVLN